MARKTASPTKESSVIPMPWMDSAWAESTDRYGSRFADNLAEANREAINYMETLVDTQMAFVRQRLNADFECAKTIAGCGDMADATRIMTAFWETMFTDYSTVNEKAGDQLRSYLAEAWTTTTAVTETAMEAANSAEEAITALTKHSAA